MTLPNAPIAGVAGHLPDMIEVQSDSISVSLPSLRARAASDPGVAGTDHDDVKAIRKWVPWSPRRFPRETSLTSRCRFAEDAVEHFSL